MMRTPWIFSSCTDAVGSGQAAGGSGRPAGVARQRRRGIVEIELLLTITLIIAILFLIRGAMNIALARMQTSQTAGFLAFHDVLASPAPQYAAPSGLPEIVGIGAVRPGLPNRVHATYEMRDVVVRGGEAAPITTVQVGGKSGLIGPFWNYSAHPFYADRAATELWFLEYVAESHAEFIGPLMLAPPWPP
jgi:hypothetical protein